MELGNDFSIGESELAEIEQRFEGVLGVSHVGIWMKSILGRRNRQCKGPEQERMWRV